jgi:hypothetical protein
MSVPASDVATTSHKRTSSAAENIIIAPSNKRRVEEPTESAAKSTPQFVYVVVVDSVPPYLPESSEIRGIYSTIVDANNAVRRLANDYDEPEEPEHGTDDDGRIYWSAGDVGEGERAEIRIQTWEVMPPGSEQECEFLNAGRDASESGSGDNEGEEVDEY